MSVLTALLALAAILYATWAFLLGRVAMPTAPAAFIAYQSINVFGIITVSRYDSDTFSWAWPFLVLASLGCFLLGALLASTSLRFRAREETSAWRASDVEDDVFRGGAGVPLIAMSLVALGIGVWFATSVGYNTFLVGFRELRTGGAVDQGVISNLREQATRGQYRAVGYVAQFTAIILPAVWIILLVLARLLRRPGLRWLAIGIAVADFYFLTIVGGRGYLVGALLGAFLIVAPATSPLPKRLRNSKKSATILATGGVFLFGFITLLQGRGSGHSAFYEGTVGVYQRLAGEYSALQVRAIGLLRPDAPVWGQEWMERLQIVLPGRDPGLMFDARLYGLLYGNTNGNLPLDPWGSYYYNFGWVGMLVVPFVFGFALQFFTVRFLVRGPRTLSRVVVLSLASYKFMFLCDPYSLLLSGPATLIIMAAVLRLLDRRRAVAPAPGPARAPTPARTKSPEGLRG